MNARTWFIAGIAGAVIAAGVASLLRRRRPSNRHDTSSAHPNAALLRVDALSVSDPALDVQEVRDATPGDTSTAGDEPRTETRHQPCDAVIETVALEPHPGLSPFPERDAEIRSAEPRIEQVFTLCPQVVVRASAGSSPEPAAGALLLLELDDADSKQARGALALDDREAIPVVALEALSIAPAPREEEEASVAVETAVERSGEQHGISQANGQRADCDEHQPTANAVAEAAAVGPAEPVGSAVASPSVPVEDTSDERAALAVSNGEADLDAPFISEDVDARPKRRTVYRDRRGSRRAKPSSARARTKGRQGSVVPAEASLRLSLHPIQRTVRFSVVLSRQEGFPDCITLTPDGQRVQAYDDRRYDDIDVPAGMRLLGDELRFDSIEQFQFLRSARRVQIFATTPTEPDQVAVSAARAGTEHAILCYATDVDEVRRIAQLAGSPPLVSHDGWPGTPAGYAVLSAYNPERAINALIEPSLRTLDPGASISIGLSGGLVIRPRVFAQGHPPHISIADLPSGTSVTIGGESAQQDDGGNWIARGWDAPGRHTIDVVPGPSLTYEIAPDPMSAGGWPRWNAYDDRFALSEAPWERAEICGAHVAAPSGILVVTDDASSVVALCAYHRAVPLRRRPDMPVSVGAVWSDAAFLLSVSGARRHQGRVVWIGRGAPTRPMQDGTRVRAADLRWASLVRGAAARRLPLIDADAIGESVWRDAVAWARRLTRGEGK